MDWQFCSNMSVDKFIKCIQKIKKCFLGDIFCLVVSENAFVSENKNNPKGSTRTRNKYIANRLLLPIIMLEL